MGENMKILHFLLVFMFGILIGYLIFETTPIGNRYFFEKASDSVIGFYKFDTWTGKAWICLDISSKNIHGCREIGKEQD